MKNKIIELLLDLIPIRIVYARVGSLIIYIFGIPVFSFVKF